MGWNSFIVQLAINCLLYFKTTALPTGAKQRWITLSGKYLTPDPVSYRYARYIPDSIWPLIQPVNIMHGTYQPVPDLWSSPLPLCTVHTRQYLTSCPTRYRMHGTQQTVPDLLSIPLPLCTVYTRQYLTYDPGRYRYATYITDSTWPLTQPFTVIPAFNCDCL